MNYNSKNIVFVLTKKLKEKIEYTYRFIIEVSVQLANKRLNIIKIIIFVNIENSWFKIWIKMF